MLGLEQEIKCTLEIRHYYMSVPWVFPKKELLIVIYQKMSVGKILTGYIIRVKGRFAFCSWQLISSFDFNASVDDIYIFKSKSFTGV